MKRTMAWRVMLGLGLTLAPFAGCDCGAVSSTAPDGAADASSTTGDGGTDGSVVGQDAAGQDALGGDASVGNQPPQVTIESPADAAQFARGESIVFRCSATDPEDGAVANQDIVWTSSLSGQIGIGARVQTGLVDVGQHTITCRATDSQGLSASDSIRLEILANFAPDVRITRPADGAYYLPSDSITFQGTATDPEDGALSGAALRWLDGSTSLGAGATVQTSLALGDHSIALEATDSQGAVGRATITIHVVSNLPPRCTITRPGDGADVLEGASVQFQATCVDPDGGAIANADIHWSSDQQGGLGIGASVQNALVLVGDHVITVCATDSTDSTLEGCQSVTVTVQANQPPTVAIERPAASAVVAACTTVSLRCQGDDPEGGDLSYTWSSDREGEVAQTRSVDWDPGLSGSHVLTCTVTDAGGKTASAQVSVTVESPSASIQEPADGSQALPGASVQFAGQGCDVEDGPLTAGRLAWSSSRDGALGSGSSLQTSALSTGQHTITLTATDADGNIGTDTITVFVNNPPSVSITAPVDPSSASLGDSVTFTGTASDAEDGSLTITWIDSTSGALGTANSLSVSTLGLGKHVVTAQVTDAAGAVATDTVSVTITDGTPLFSTTSMAGEVRAIRTNPDGGFFVATSAGLQLWEPGAGAPTTYDQGNSDLPDDSVNDVAVLADGTLLVATAGGLAVCASPGSGQTGSPTDCTVFDSDQGYLDFASSNMTALAVLPDGRVLVGTSECLVFWNSAGQQNDRICQGDGQGDELLSSSIRDLTYDPTTGQVWIATGSGVSLMTPSNAGSVNADNQTFTDVRQSDGLASNEVRAIAVAPSGLVWFACSTGLTVLERAAGGDLFTTYDTGDGLLSSSVRDVAIDVVSLGGTSHELAWAATAGGLARVDHAIPSVVVLTTDDGLASNDCRSVAVDAAHIKYVGTAAGISAYRGQ